VHAVDVPGRGEAAGVADLVRDPADLGQVVAVVAVERFVLDSLQHRERAPRDVVVDRGDLAGEPHHADDREGRLGVQYVPDEAARVAAALVGGQQVDRRQLGTEHAGHGEGGLAGVGVANGLLSDARDEACQAGASTRRGLHGQKPGAPHT
jgi:hypothetical protein